MRVTTIIGVSTVLFLVTNCGEAEARKWTDKTGKFSVEADFVSLADGAVNLKRPDGQVIKIPLEKLSETDQEVARAVAQIRNNPRDAQDPFVPTKEKSESVPPKSNLATPPDAREPSMPSQEASPADKKSEDAGTLRKVIATGQGTTEEEAKQSAFHNAVEQAIGVLVDATTVVDNDKILSDKVLTYSNGYIKSYKVDSSGKTNGLFSVRIAAQVKVQALSDKLQSLSISMRQKVDGSSIAGEAVTKAKRDKDGGAMLVDLFQGFPAKCLAIAAGSLKTEAADDKGRTDLTVPVTVTVDPERYRAFDTSLRTLLGKMAVRQQSYSLVPTDLRLLKNGHDENGLLWPDHARIVQPGGIPVYSFLGAPGGLSKLHFGKHGSTPPETFGVALYDVDRSSPRKTYWTVFELGKEHLAFFQNHSRVRYSTSFSRTQRNTKVFVSMSIKLLDAGSNTLADEEFTPDIVEGRCVPRQGTVERPCVALEGVHNDPTDQIRRLEVTLDLINPHMTEQGFSDKLVDLFPIAPLFHYPLPSNFTHAYSPEVRFAVTFKGLEVSIVEKVKRIECSVTVAEQARKGDSQ